jgi:hypothetical protein
MKEGAGHDQGVGLSAPVVAYDDMVTRDPRKEEKVHRGTLTGVKPNIPTQEKQHGHPTGGCPARTVSWSFGAARQGLPLRDTQKNYSWPSGKILGRL